MVLAILVFQNLALTNQLTELRKTNLTMVVLTNKVRQDRRYIYELCRSVNGIRRFLILEVYQALKQQITFDNNVNENFATAERVLNNHTKTLRELVRVAPSTYRKK
jgi:hypothetical protein